MIGNVVRAATGSFHPQCFRCEECDMGLEMGVWIVDGRLIIYSFFPSICFIFSDFSVTIARKTSRKRVDTCVQNVSDGLVLPLLPLSHPDVLPISRHHFIFLGRQSIDKHELLRYKDDFFHAYHFDCTKCG